MGPILGQSYADWKAALSPEDVDAILAAHYENELQHILDMQADSQVQEELDGRA